uniref:POTRA domain-containing protein n=1 Tax=Hydropuntia rangiferina TaxID=338881 RepID=A0A345U8B9_9FLOR|nr:hypothetical protein [Hydropuntia rangiferina]AXI96705.1 hypothetical protein [Hydropuntia rangiferina]UAD87388.1 hypothetical protein [Hydropuntia rangiferina]
MIFMFYSIFITIFSLSNKSTEMFYPNSCAIVHRLYSKKIPKLNKIHKTQAKINKCNKYLLKTINIINKNQYNKTYNLHFNNIFLIKYINTFKKSGYVSSINKYTILNPKYKQKIFDININPIISKINITTYKKLIIHPQYLQMLLNLQLGKPKNYLLINSIIKCIQSWYLKRGYKWSNINIDNLSQINELNLTINEGKIHKVYVKHKSHQIKKKVNFMN